MPPSRTTHGGTDEDWLKTVYHRVQALKFGTIQITVHDSRVVQIDTTDRQRLNTTGTPGADESARG